jgi:hypothetical protein
MTTTPPTRIGETTVAACAASSFAQVRHDDPVVAIDADTAFGRLGARAAPPRIKLLHETPVAKLRLDGTPTPRSWVARMTKRLAASGAGKSAPGAGGSAIGVVHAERRDSPNQSIRPAGRTVVRATGCTECKSEVRA